MFSEVVRVDFLEVDNIILSPTRKCCRLMDGEWRCGGSEFQTTGTATEKLCRRPSLVVLIHGTN